MEVSVFIVQAHWMEQQQIAQLWRYKGSSCSGGVLEEFEVSKI
jgi:hypothetical protein